MIDIKDKSGKVLSIIDNVNSFKKGHGFYGKELDFIQVVSFNYDKGKVFPSHKHIYHESPTEFKSQEVIIIIHGSIECTLFDDDNNLVYTTVLKEGDFCITYNGGCGRKTLEDNTIMIEAKAGQFLGSDKDRVLI